MNNTLTDQQKKLILEEWDSREANPPSLLELIKIAFPDNPELDGRTKEGKAVKAFLASNQIRARASHEYIPKEDIELTGEHQEFSRNHAANLKPYEIARILFKNIKLLTLIKNL